MPDRLEINLGVMTVFTIEPPKAKAKAKSKVKSMPMPQQESFGLFVDPDLFRAAQEIYNFYCQVNPDRGQRREPVGVAVNKYSQEGKLIFSSSPVLLPDECFISVQKMESEFLE
jgi:hypothetical protein